MMFSSDDYKPSSSSSSLFSVTLSPVFSSLKRIQLAKEILNTILSRLLTISLSSSYVAMGALKWKPTSPEQLEQCESRLLSFMRKIYTGSFINIGSGWGRDENLIWTIQMEATRSSGSCGNNNNNHSTSAKSQHQSQSQSQAQSSAKPMPLVMLHGFGCGAGIWCLNMDSLSENRKIYAFDVLGFARSSRPFFSRSEKMAEFELVESIERWRRAIGLNEKFILLGHSFGGYLSLAYALQFPEHVAHVVLADPWGIPSEQTASASTNAQIALPSWVKIVARFIFKTMNPLSVLRIAGPFGPGLVHKLRPDIRKKFEPLTGEQDASLVLDYVYHCNAHSNPAGEVAFKTLAHEGWAKNPMIKRIDRLDANIDLTFIYGERSWIDRQPGLQIKQMCSEKSVEVHVIHGAGHHVYADKLEDFNRLVNEACRDADERNRIRREQEMETNLHD